MTNNNPRNWQHDAYDYLSIQEYEMNADHIEYFRSVLNEELDQLLTKAELTIAMLTKPHENEVDLIDKASSQANQAFNLRIRDRESILINKIKESLVKIDNNEFGICEACGEDISWGRLMARPMATKCIKCKENEEKEEFRKGQ